MDDLKRNTWWVMGAVIVLLVGIIIGMAVDTDAVQDQELEPPKASPTPSPTSPASPTSVPTPSPTSPAPPTSVSTPSPVTVTIVAPEGTVYGTENIAWMRQVVTETLACLYTNALSPEAPSWHDSFSEAVGVAIQSPGSQRASDTAGLVRRQLEASTGFGLADHYLHIDNFIERVIGGEGTPDAWQHLTPEEELEALRFIACSSSEPMEG